MCHYNHTAHIYNTRYAEEQTLKIEAAARNLKLRKQGSILDLGCGTGLLLTKIRTMAKNIVCLDVSKGMLREIETGIKHLPSIHLILADADNAPIRDDFFDTVFAITLLQNMPSPHQTLQEMKRITKPDATIIVTGLKKHFTQSYFLRLLEDAALKTKQLKADDKLKCYIALCEKTTSAP